MSLTWAAMNAIETRALRKVYPSSIGKLTPPWGSPWARPSDSEPGHGGEVVALAELDLNVREGEFFGLLGPNGAGKTTTIGILTTRVKATSGSARVAGADVDEEDAAVRQRIGVVPQRPNPDRGLNVAENLLYHAAYFGIGRQRAQQKASALLDRLGIGDKADSSVDTLSGGQQQRLMIARALIHEPTVIFLDEPTVGLDPRSARLIKDLLVQLGGRGVAVFLSTHILEIAERMCDRVVIIDKGAIVASGTLAELRSQGREGSLEDIFLSLTGGAEYAAIAEVLA
jgi:ABC-2 type transport system ATP-binding protein